MSTIKVNAIQNTSGVEQYLAKAWVNFNGTGTVAIRASGNVSSITDTGVGRYTVNLTSPTSDQHYSWASSASQTGAGVADAQISVEGVGSSQTSSGLPIWVKRSTALIDVDYVFVTIFR